MLKELLISVASGIIVALLLQMFRFGGGRREQDSVTVQRRAMSVAPSRDGPRRSKGGGLGRFIMAVVGGVILATVAAPFVMDALHDGGGRGGWGGGGPRGRYYDGGGPGGYFDRGGDAIFGLPPMLVLTIVCTVVIWALLSAMRRR